MSGVILLAGLAIAEGWARHNLYDEWYVRSPSPNLRFELKSEDQRARFDDSGRIQLHKPPGSLRIAVLGDSVAWGSHLSPGQTIPRKLEESLRATPIRPGETYEVINAAVPGYDIHQALATYRERVLPYDPDVVLYLFAVNDYVVSDFIEANGQILMVLPSSDGDTIGHPGAIVGRLVTSSAIAAWVYTAVLARKYKNPRDELIRIDYEWGARSLAAMADLAQAEGDWFIPFLLGPLGAELPSDEQCLERGLAIELCWMTLALAHAREHCGELQLNCVDINDMLRAQPGRDFRITSGDLMHPNEEGAEIWAEAIAEHLRQGSGR